MGEMRIYPIDGHFVLADEGYGWLPGAYESEAAARLAFGLDVRVLQNLQDEVNARESDPAKRVITAAMLRAAQHKSAVHDE